MQAFELFEHFGLDPADPSRSPEHSRELSRALSRELARDLSRLPESAPEDWRNLAVALARYVRSNRLRVLGVGGGQGAGKSTLSRLVKQAHALHGGVAEVVSLDDFYLTRAERARLASRVHPLLATRGVPGTHDVAAMGEAIENLFRPGTHQLPRFDKGADERCEDPAVVQGPVDLVVVEGWCVGARPQPEALLGEPVNELESSRDAAGKWRGFVNAQLQQHYVPLWEKLDALLFLAVPDLAAVIRWRGEQELERPAPERLTPAQIRQFVAHYERLTGWMLQTLPETAEIVGFLDAEHRLARLTVRG